MGSPQYEQKVVALLAIRGEERMVVYLVYRDPQEIMKHLRSAGWEIGPELISFPQPWQDVIGCVVYVGDHPKFDPNTVRGRRGSG